MQDSPLPEDLARPRRDRASLVANLITAAALLMALAVFVLAVMVAT